MDDLLHIFPLTSDAWKDAHKTSNQGDDSEKSSSKSVLSKLNSGLKEHLVLVSAVEQWHLPLLFQCAVSYASEGKRVLFIRRKPLERLPLSVHGMSQPEASVLKNVKFMYYTSVRDLISFCANVHTQTLPPETVIVDDLGYFIQQMKELSPEQGMVKLWCLLTDAVHFIEQKSGERVPLVLAIHDKIKSLPDLCWRFPIKTAVITGPASDDAKFSVKMTFKHHVLCCTYEMGTGGLMLASVQVT
ncbi:uncharacterized protein LOC135482247 [Liolophura sinensis]|uniref:uncharacterized protein LOC135482247 n=1 Tax=Liolophura sinensis TaxID=3198878 RepID=UPI00315923BE